MSTGAEKIALGAFIEREAARWRGLLDLAANLKELGGIEQAQADLKMNLARLEAQTADARAAVTAAKAEAERILSEARKSADALVEEARTIKAAAESEAADTRSKAKADAASIVDAANQARGALEAELRAEVSRNVDAILKRGKAS